VRKSVVKDEKVKKKKNWKKKYKSLFDFVEKILIMLVHRH
jgi:hypothetical protein